MVLECAVTFCIVEEEHEMNSIRDNISFPTLIASEVVHSVVPEVRGNRKRLKITDIFS